LAGLFYVVSTPIGNLEDITFRAVKTLKEVDLIATEDTRKIKVLLTKYNIHTPATSYFQYNRKIKDDYLITLLKKGKHIALVSNAGTPLISDPGFSLIRRLIDEKICFTVIPGASAVTSAVVISGIKCDDFIFLGFLPRKEGKIKKIFRELSLVKKSLVFFESPFRIKATVEILSKLELFSEMAIVKEMTKRFEEVIRGSIQEVNEIIKKRSLKGEITVVLR